MRNHYVFGRSVSGDLSREDLQVILAEARTRQAALAALPVDGLLNLLERVGRAWADPDFEPRRRVLETLPAQIGFSRQMVELELSGLTMALTRPYLEGKLAAELGRLDAQDVWHRKGGSAVFQKAVPRGVVLHVASGNVSTTGVLSLIEGLLTRNVNVLKVASNAPMLPLLFARTLAELDDEGVVAGAFAILSWSGEKTPHHELFQQQADAIVVWGGEEVVQTYRQGLSLGTKLIEYGPKVSAALYGAEALTPDRLADTAALAARDISLWDQSACSSPQVIYLEDPDGTATERFVSALAPALEALAAELPMGALSMQEQAEITKEREMALVDELMGLGRLVTPDHQGWTIVVEHDITFKLSPLFRTIYLKPVATLDVVFPQLAPYKHYLQTIALAVAPARAGVLAEAAIARGALRVVRAGEMSGGHPGEPHDGQYGLHELVRWVSLDTPEAADAFDGTVFLSAAQSRAITFAKRRRLIESLAPTSPLYRERFAGLPLRTEDDWLALPLLEKADVQAHTPPTGTGLLTEAPMGGHWLRSGGSTGDPKLSIFAYEDYEADMWRGARGAHAAGLRRGDKVANLFFSGDLYGSFLSLNRVLELVGCNSFPFTNHAPVESVLHCLKAFEIETVIGLSSWVQAVLQEAMKDPAGLHVRHVLYAGEHFHDKERQALRAGLGITRVTSIGYGAVDAGPMGYQCAHCPGAVHHLHADHVYLEILDPATGLPVVGEAPGEIVVTNLNRRLMPLIRYRIGDRGRWVPGDCACGSPAPRFELLGRVEEGFLAGDAAFQYREIQAVVEGFGPLHSSPQVELTGSATADRVAIRAELVGTGADAAGLAAQLREGLLARVPALGRPGVELAVEVVPVGQLERVGRTGKIVRIIDRRTPTPKADGR
ncbi:MAG: acyl-CoA reductase [Candidatus Sericytochromatia bacterium]